MPTAMLLATFSFFLGCIQIVLVQDKLIIKFVEVDKIQLYQLIRMQTPILDSVVILFT